MPPSDWTWDPKAEGAGWGAHPGDKGVEREATTQEEGRFNIHLLSNVRIHVSHKSSLQSCCGCLSLFVSAAPCRRWRTSSRGSSRSRRSSSRWAANPNALTPPPRVESPNSTPSQTCTTPVYSLASVCATKQTWLRSQTPPCGATSPLRYR